MSDDLNHDSLLVNDTEELIPQSSSNQEILVTESNENPRPNNDSGVQGILFFNSIIINYINHKKR